MPVSSEGVLWSRITAGQKDLGVRVRRARSAVVWRRCRLACHWLRELSLVPEIRGKPVVQRPSSSGGSEAAADSSSGLMLTRSRSVLEKSSPTHSSGSPATEATA
jgi:hypothetical protein